jgi:organic hydroperoxide reductase OsmC/OhrA
MDKIKPLYTAAATATGGRNGHTESSDGIVKADLSVPKEMGGPGKPGKATLEHLFAAGHAACFGGALDFVGKQHRKDASKASITCGLDRAARHRWLQPGRQAAHRRPQPSSGGTAGARHRGAREHLPVLERHAQQYRRSARSGRRLTALRAVRSSPASANPTTSYSHVRLRSTR